MKTIEPLRLIAGPGCTPITRAQLAQFIPEADIEKGESRFGMTLKGPWQICTRIRGLATTAEWKDGPTHRLVDSYTLHGFRSMSKPKAMGYDMEGRISLEGRSRRAFTSSILFEVTDMACPTNGRKLVSVACLHVCEK